MPPDDSGMVYLLEQLRESVEQAHAFRKELRESLETWKEEVTIEIREYKRTVNAAINLLSSDSFSFQKTTKERLDKDDTERAARQLQVDKRDRVLIGTAGCLVVVSVVSTLVIVGVVVWVLTR